MNRLTRLVTRLKSPELQRRFVSLNPQKTLTFALIQSSSLRFSNVGSFSTNSVNPPPIANPNPTLEPLSESIAVTGAERERRELPEELSRNVVVLTCESSAQGGSCDVYLVGTIHYSQDSCKQVRAIMQFLKPEVVFLELCSRHAPVILTGTPQNEFSVASEEARSYGGKVILGDLPEQITLWKAWGNLPAWYKRKLVYSLLYRAVFQPSSLCLYKKVREMDHVDMLQLVVYDTSEEFVPTALVETYVHERDQFMSCSLLDVARKHSSVVAVVGKEHLQGIKEHWKQPVEMMKILKMPSQKESAFKLLGVAVAGATIINGVHSFFRRCNNVKSTK